VLPVWRRSWKWKPDKPAASVAFFHSRQERFASLRDGPRPHLTEPVRQAACSLGLLR
jgi:hypothetical protein